MNFQPLEIPDLILVTPRVFSDSRGYFYEGYNQTVFEKGGIREHFVQDNYSLSSKGVFRGLHYQLPPRAQAKLVSVLRGAALDVMLDVRKNSKTFGKAVTYRLTGEKKEMIFVPPGFAHGFCALEDNTEFMYKVTDFYSPAHERGILGSDPDILVKWPSLSFILSDKDQKYPRLKDAEVF